jgi:hypothetical protein
VEESKKQRYTNTGVYIWFAYIIVSARSPGLGLSHPNSAVCYLHPSGMTTQNSLISVLDACDNFRPHLSPEHLVPFLLAPNARPALGLLRPPVVAALRADNAWRNSHGLPPAWDIPAPADADKDSENPPPPPYIAFAPSLAHGTPAARTRALASTLERWRAAANRDDGSGASVFSSVIGGSRWRSEWYDVYRVPGGGAPLRADGRDPLTVLEVPPGGPGAGYVLSMERSACAIFGVVTYGVHMTVYERDACGPGGEGEGQTRVWVPRRALTKPTYAMFFFFFLLLYPTRRLTRLVISLVQPTCTLVSHGLSLSLFFRVCAVTCKVTPVCSTTRSQVVYPAGRPRSTLS